MKVIKNYGSFNHRRYGNPWVTIVNPKTAKPDFSKEIGGYTGGYGRGEAGELYVNDPQENAVYMFGQKDYRGNNTERQYVQYKNGEFIPVSSENLVEVLSDASSEQEEPQSTDEFGDQYTDEEKRILSCEKSEDSDIQICHSDMPERIKAIDDDLRHFNAKYVYLNIELNYPELEGTEKQINYAQNLLKQAAIDYVDTYFSFINTNSKFGYFWRNSTESQKQSQERYKAEIEDLMRRAREKGATEKDTENLSRFVVWMIENDTANSLWAWTKVSGKAGEVIEMSQRLSAKGKKIREQYRKEFLFNEA